MSSGISVDDSVNQAWDEMKTNRKYKYLVFRMNDAQTKIIIDSTGEYAAKKNPTYEENMADFEELKTALLKVKDEGGCRYATFDMWFDAAGRLSNKIVFISWCPDSSAIKQKMVYSSSKDAIKKKLEGVGLLYQANDDEALDYEEVKAAVKAGKY